MILGMWCMFVAKYTMKLIGFWAPLLPKKMADRALATKQAKTGPSS